MKLIIYIFHDDKMGWFYNAKRAYQSMMLTVGAWARLVLYYPVLTDSSV
jgi:hypothetical protein